MAEQTLDCSNLNCPMPIVKVAKAFKTLEEGDTLAVTATDPAFQADIEAWVRRTGQELINFEATEGDTQIATLKKVK